jgi:hypothetical protein
MDCWAAALRIIQVVLHVALATHRQRTYGHMPPHARDAPPAAPPNRLRLFTWVSRMLYQADRLSHAQ